MKTLLPAASLAACISVSAVAILGGGASAQTAGIRIFVADLNLKTPEGMAQFKTRVDLAARQMCDGYERLRAMDKSACVRAVRDEAQENLSTEMARRDNAHIASVAAGR
jgi:UrcA family protein